MRNRTRATTPEVWERLGVDPAELMPVLMEAVDEGRGRVQPAVHERRSSPSSCPTSGSSGSWKPTTATCARPGVRPGSWNTSSPTTRPGLRRLRRGGRRSVGHADRGPRPPDLMAGLRGAAAIVGVADAVSPTGELDAPARRSRPPWSARPSLTAASPSTTSTGCATPRRRCSSPSTWASTPASPTRPTTGGSSFEVHAEHAAAAIAAGLCEVVVERVRGHPPQRPHPPRGAGPASCARSADANPCSSGRCPTGCAMPMGAYALAATRHMARVRHHLRAAGPDRGVHPRVGDAQPEGPLPGPHHRRRRAGLADAVARRCTCSTAAWSPTAPAPSS